jgi:predicted N-acetyltransferase YhbS
MAVSELGRISEIDRSEHIRQEYRSHGGSMELVDVDVHVPRWGSTGAGEHTVQKKIESWRPVLESGGVLVGAFEGDQLVGFSIYDPFLAEGVANMAVLHISRMHRRNGIGRLLADEVGRLARADGAERLYVSATPTRGTVDFYAQLGFRPVATPDKRLLAMEPDDIHMDRKL